VKNLIEIKNNVLQPAPEILLVEDFHKIWKRDKSKVKERALKELAYVYHTTDYQSVYRNYHPDIQEGKIKLDLFGDKEWKPDEYVRLAQSKYQELQTTLSMELLRDVELGLTKLRDYFRNAEFDEDEDGRNARNFIANVKAMGDVVKGIKSLKEEVEKELTDKMQLRGGSTIGRRELPPDRRG